MLVMKALFILLQFSLFTSCVSQTYWSIKVDADSSRNEFFQSLQRTETGRICLVGASGLKNLDYSDLNNFYTAISDSGEIELIKTITVGISGSLNFSLLNDNYGIMEGTFHESVSPYDSQNIFMKINTNTGDTIWVRKYGSPTRHQSSEKMIKTSDCGLVVVGWDFPINNSERSKISIVKIDSAGNLLFRKLYTSDSNKIHYGQSLIERPDSGLIICGFTKYTLGNVTSIRDMVLVGADKYGNQEWMKTYSSLTSPYQDGYPPLDIIRKKDGNYLICGFKAWEYPSYYNSKYAFTTISPHGVLIDSVSYENHNNSVPIRIIATKDSNFMAIGYERNKDIDPQYGMLMKVSQDMKILWKRLYRMSPPESKIHDIFLDAITMPDSGFVLCGIAYGPLADSTYQNGWVIRVDSLGCLEPGCDTIISTASPISDEVAGITVFPNPTSDEITVQTEQIILGYRLVDLSGRVVQDLQFTRQAGVRQFVVPLREQAAGVYLLAVHTEKGWLVKKIIKS